MRYRYINQTKPRPAYTSIGDTANATISATDNT